MFALFRRCLLATFLIGALTAVAISQSTNADTQDPPPKADGPADATALDTPPVTPGQNPFGGGFGGFPSGFSGMSLPPSAIPSSHYTSSRQILVAWSEKGDTAWGFSKATGRWSKVELKPPVTNLPKSLILTEQMAAIQAGNTLYGYGGGSGRWDTLRLPEGRTPLPTLEQDLILVVDGRTIYTLASNKGVWTSSADADIDPDASVSSKLLQDLVQTKGDLQTQQQTLGSEHPTVKALQQRITAIEAALAERQSVRAKTFDESAAKAATPPANTPAGPKELKIFSLQNMTATEAARLLSDILIEKSLAITADPRTNSVIARGDSEDLLLCEAILLRLDEQATRPKVDTPAEPAANSALIRLKFADASDVAGVLKKLFPGNRYVIIAEPVSNSILVHAPNSDFNHVEAAIRSRDVPLPVASNNTVSFVPRIPDQLRNKYDKLDRQAFLMAQELRDVLEKFGPQHPETQSGQAALRRGVVAAFEARQDLQRAELAALQQRLTAIQQSIAAREQNKDEIINRRVADLLNPAARWEMPSTEAPSTGNSSRVSSTPSSAAPNDSKTMDAQVRFVGPEGAMLMAPESTESVVRLPGRINLATGQTHRFSLVEIPSHSQLQLSLSLVLFSPSLPAMEFYLRHNAIPVQIVNEDIDQAKAGQFVTKVIYLPDAKFQELANANVETLVSTRLDPGRDPHAEAASRGQILAVLRIESTPDKSGSTAARRQRQPATISDSADKALQMQMFVFDVAPQADLSGLGLDPTSTRILSVPAKDDFSAQFQKLTESRKAQLVSRPTIRTRLGQPATVQISEAMELPTGLVLPNPTSLWIGNEITVLPTLFLVSEWPVPVRQLQLQVTIDTHSLDEQSTVSTPTGKIPGIRATRLQVLLEAPRVGQTVIVGPYPSSEAGKARFLAFSCALEPSPKSLPSPPRTTDDSLDPFTVRWPVVNSTLDGDGTLRMATDLRTRLRVLNERIAAETLRREQQREELGLIPKNTHMALQKLLQELSGVRAEYEAQVKLLKLDLQDAESALNAAKTELHFKTQLAEKKVLSTQELQAQERLVEQAHTRVERARIVLDLYLKVEQEPLSAPRDPASSVSDTQADAVIWKELGLKLELAHRNELASHSKFRGGLKITAIRPDGPAHVAGLRIGDILVGIGNYETATKQNVVWTLWQKPADSAPRSTRPPKLECIVIRDKDVLRAELEFGGTVANPDPAGERTPPPK